MTKTALIFAYECAPYNRPGSTIGAQRPYQMAKYLAQNGWKTIVLTCNNKLRRSTSTVDKNQIGKLIENGLQELEEENWTIVALPSLHCDGMVDWLWWKTVTLDKQNGTVKPKRGLLLSLIRKVLTIIKLTKGDHSQGWQKPANYAADLVAKKYKIDLVMGEHGPDAGLFLAKRFHRKFGTPWVMDFRDPVDIGVPNILRKLYLRFIKQILASSSLLINVTPYWKELDRKRFEKNVICITNGYDPDEFETKENANTTNYFDILYPGNVHEKQNIELFLSALSLCIKEDNLDRLRFIYCGGQSNYINKLLIRYQLEKHSKIYKSLPRSKALILMQSASVLLIMGVVSNDKSNRLIARGVYPGKVFEYFGAKRPILLAPTDDGILEELIINTRSGVVCKNIPEIRKFINKSYDNWENGLPVFPINTTLTIKYNRYNQMKRLSNMFDEISESNYE